MKNSVDSLIKDPKHHAYIIFGKLEDVEKENNLHTIIYEKKIGVEDVRDLFKFASQSTGGEVRKIILKTPGITFQSQNALLKMFEEMQGGVYFFLSVPHGVNIIDTLLSRCFVFNIENDNEKISNDFKNFINSSTKDRLSIIDNIWSKEDVQRDEEIVDLIQNLEIYTHSLFSKKDFDSENIDRCMKITYSIQNAMQNRMFSRALFQSVAFI